MIVVNNLPVNNKNFFNNYVAKPNYIDVRNFGLQKDTVSFSGAIKPAKVNDAVNIGKSKLINQFDKILSTIPREISEEELEEIIANNYAAFERAILNKMAKLEERVLGSRIPD